MVGPGIMTKAGRNQPCPCGSGKKYKRCCGSIAAPPQPRPASPEMICALERHYAAERIRQEQQGLGRPIIAGRVNDYQIVAVGKTIHWSKKAKTFADFLGEYIKRTLGSEWGNAELAKPLEQRHTLLQWYDTYCRYQVATITTPSEVSTAEMTGVVACSSGIRLQPLSARSQYRVAGPPGPAAQEPARVSGRLL